MKHINTEMEPQLNDTYVGSPFFPQLGRRDYVATRLEPDRLPFGAGCVSVFLVSILKLNYKFELN